MTKFEFFRTMCVREVNLVTRYTAYRTGYPMKNGGRTHAGFIYTLTGTETYRFSDRAISSPPGTLLYIPRGEKYTIDFHEEKSVVIAFDFELAETGDVRPFCINLSKESSVRTHFFRCGVQAVAKATRK